MVEFIDPYWEKEYAENLKLSILLGVDSFSFSVMNHKNVILAFREYDWDIVQYQSASEILSLASKIMEDSIFKGTYNAVSYQIIPSQFTFLPHRLFDKNKLAIYFEHLTGEEDVNDIKFTEIGDLDLMVIYKENLFQQNLSQILYPERPFMPIFKSILPFLKNQDIYDTHLFCRISKNSLVLFVYRDKFLLFANQFYCYQISDFQYFILLTCNQFQLNPSHETLYLWGDCDEDSEVLKELNSLFSKVRFLNAQWIISPDTKTRILPEAKVLEHLLIYSR